MANPTAPFGARLTRSIADSYTGKIRTYVLESTDGVALYVGDFVKSVGDLGTDRFGNLRPVVTRAAAADVITGVVVAFEADPDDLATLYRKPNVVKNVYVYEFPYGEFEIRASGEFLAEDRGLNADIVYLTPNPQFGRSGMALNMATKTTSSAQVRIIGLATRIEGNEVGEGAVLNCMVNEHFFKATSGV